jgi:hypothetical protein
MSRQEWDAVVGDMVQRGAVGTQAEMRSVVDYLARNLGRTAGPEMRKQ